MADKKSKTQKLPLLPLRDVIIFPHMVVPLFVGREKSIEALEKASKNGNELFLVTQKDASILDPERADVYDIGTVVNIIQMLRLPDNTVKVLIEGKHRAKLKDFECSAKGYTAEIAEFKDFFQNEAEVEAMVRSLKGIFEQYVKLNKRIPPELLMSISSITDPSRLGDVLVAHLSLKIEEKQEILEEVDVAKRLQLLLQKMQGEIEIINVEKRIRSRVKNQMEKSQKEYYLNEQMSAIQKELGKGDSKDEIKEMEDKLKERSEFMTEESVEKTQKEIDKLKSMSPMSAESAVVRNYIDWMISLPWKDYEKEDNDVPKAREILDEDHYGLQDVKSRIVEYLAVKSLAGDNSRGTILCMGGPPGVGKTSIATSLARALNRKFVRISLGGVRDEAEIRGHRRTYVGALPGKIIQAMKKAKTGNPVILLDEIDKMSSDMRGDPASAMLEVLDPEQNKNFTDHYLEVEYDLSRVMFIMTANDIHKIPGPLKDRMEIINIAGYTPFEKLQIAKKYLIKKAIKHNGLGDYKVQIGDKSLMDIIRGYTREAGVRELERTVNTIARKVATDVVEKDHKVGKKFNITPSSLKKHLGAVRFEKSKVEEEAQVGLVNGLAYTSVGGEVLNIEVITMPGHGKIEITGKLGDVMQESAKTALSFVRSISSKLRIDPKWYDENDIHIHVPEGAVPKDGPSAGITLTTAICSAVANISVRQDIAMTGEVTLRGRVLPIGGLKEKMLGAKQAGIKTIIIPEKNAKDLEEIPKEIKDGMTVYPCFHVEEVLKHALELDSIEDFLTPAPNLTVVDGESEMVKVAN